MADLSAFWPAVETVHDVVYFAPDVEDRYVALGLRDWWMGYFASRAALMGEVSPAVVAATFHGFAPAMVQRALPEAWSLVEREVVLAERLAVAVDSLRPVLAGLDVDVPALVERLAEVVDGLELSGLPLAAAEASSAVPDEPVAALWRHVTVLRELRGDAHVAALVVEGLGGATATVLARATGRVREDQQQVRGWSDAAWAAAHDRLRAVGWLDEAGGATLMGRASRDRLEETTDRACANRFDAIRAELAERLTPDLVVVARAVASAGAVPFPNPIGGVRP